MASAADGVDGQGSASGRTMHWRFVAAILSGSFLLFLVQPMVARMALPKLGGAPAVWNSAMLVYQALLLGGYAYAHWLGRIPPRMQAAVHLGVLALAALWLPIGMMAMNLPPDAEPALWVPWLFGASIGPLFFAVAAQAPLIQRWYAVSTHGRNPYWLYAASNIGSFGGLIVYPLLVEPLMTLKSQSMLWTAGYALVFVLVAACALAIPRRAKGEVHVRHTSPAPGARMVGKWIALSFVPSGLMLATTTFLTTDIVAVPLLWVVPLGLYLLSFTVAFRDSEAMDHILGKFTPVVLLLFGATLIAGNQKFALFNAIIGVALLFLVSVACHARMYRLRPAPDRLTGFYLAMSVGGALGGVFAGLIAPIVFDWTYEYPLLILAAGMLVPQSFLMPVFANIWGGSEQVQRVKVLAAALVVALFVLLGMLNPGDVLGPMHDQISFVLIALAGLLMIGKRWAYVAALTCALFVFGVRQSIQISLAEARTRSYFGVYTVADLPHERRLAHGTTLHGVQLKGVHSREPTTYYMRGSGVGRAMEAAPELYGPGARIAVVGLGTGTLACYARPGQHWTFYEIDPAVVHLARDSGSFTFLPQCTPDADVVVGDARLRLAEAGAASLDLLALDAFSSDAVPMHLLTREAFAGYARVLAPNGLLMVHISNRFLDLAPVVAGAAAAGGWHAARLDYVPSTADKRRDGSESEWIALSRDRMLLDRLTVMGGFWRPLEPWPGFAGWTDDYASIVPVLRLGGTGN